MKKIMAIVLIGLLGFLGCSGDDNDTNTIGEATPVDPFGIEDTMTQSFEWTPVEWATRYHLLVQEVIQDSTTQDATETYIIDEWYTAGEAGCDSEEDLCMVTPEIEFDGTYTWKVLACAGGDCGLWSEDFQFSYPPPNTQRFTDNGDGTVTDNNTNLMWSKDANPFRRSRYIWDAARRACDEWSFAGYSDWRLPELFELKSLIYKYDYDPALPPGNPFEAVSCGFYYWSSTTYGNRPDSSLAYSVYFYSGSVDFNPMGSYFLVWPVRWHLMIR